MEFKIVEIGFLKKILNYALYGIDKFHPQIYERNNTIKKLEENIDNMLVNIKRDGSDG